MLAATGSGTIAASGTFASYAVTGEGLTGEGAYNNVTVGYAATPVTQRTVTADTVVLGGKYLSGASLANLGALAVTLRSTGDDANYTRITVDGHNFNSTESFATTAIGSGTIGNSGALTSYAVVGEGLTGEGSYANVNVNYTAAVVGNAQADQSGSRTAFADALTAVVAPSGSLAGLQSQTTAVVNSGVGGGSLVGTTANLLAGINTGNSTSDVSMAWRTRTVGEVDRGLLADVVDLHTGTSASDLFVLQMSYDANKLLLSGGLTEQFLAQQGGIYLSWLNDSNQWVNAIDGNIGLNVGVRNFQGSWSDAGNTLDLGAWGVDTDNDVVWAVVNHNSQFSAVGDASVPEPATIAIWSILGAFGFGFAWLRKRKAA